MRTDLGRDRLPVRASGLRSGARTRRAIYPYAAAQPLCPRCGCHCPPPKQAKIIIRVRRCLPTRCQSKALRQSRSSRKCDLRPRGPSAKPSLIRITPRLPPAPDLPAVQYLVSSRADLVSHSCVGMQPGDLQRTTPACCSLPPHHLPS